MPNREAADALRNTLRGTVILPQDPQYDVCRTVWNAMTDRHPAIIARCASVEDVQAAVRFAAERDLSISVRGGGHNVAGTAVCDDGLMIDLSDMRAVTVDPQRRRALAQGGATMRDLDRATQAHGLATPGGVVSSTGLGGLTLGGGFGWLARKHGLAADNLASIDLVAADGTLHRASADDDPELFWGLRGGGGNFGVATRLEYRLHPVGPDILFGPTVHRLEDAPEVLRTYRAFAAEAPRACCVWADLLTAPPLPFLPECFHGTKVISLMQCYVDDPEHGEVVLAPLRGFGSPIGDAVMVRPYTEAQSILDAAYDAGARNYWSAQNFTGLDDPVPDTLFEIAGTLPTPESDLLVCQLGGAICDPPIDATAYPHRDAAFAITAGARWRDPAGDARCVAWVRRASATLAPHATAGAYANFVSEASGREAAVYGRNLPRLAALKARVDPSNRFRWNQNIAPVAPHSSSVN